MTTLTYPDAYLAKFCTVDREARAFDYVDGLGTFNESWRNKLTIVRCYILACLENQASEEDLFTAKLKTYRQDFDAMLTQARAATPDDQGLTLPIFSIPLERG
jgi:hypothetical protein